MSKIPSDEDFERAERLEKERSRNLEKVRANIMRRFSSRCPLHYFHIMWQIDVNFRAYVFFKEDKDIEVCRTEGIVEQLKDAVYEELEQASRGKKGDVSVVFEFDSDENVAKVFDGNYYLRLL